MKKAIILGNDHTNSLGVVQSLAERGWTVDAYVWGVKNGFLTRSKYINMIYSSSSAESCIDLIIGNTAEIYEVIPVVPCCDTAALVLERRREEIPKNIVFGHIDGKYTIAEVQDKELQVKLARSAGLNVPSSFKVSDRHNIPKELSFDAPYIIKPIISIYGSKADIIKCSSLEELHRNIEMVFDRYSIRQEFLSILIEKFIPHDYEISLLGCVLSDGEVYIPAIENKLTQFPLNIGLECTARVEEFKDLTLKNQLVDFVKSIGYRGLFSIEMMHNPEDGRFYFDEINLRNDGANIFIKQFGVNLPHIYCSDLLGIRSQDIMDKEYHPGLYIWEVHHFDAMRAGTLTVGRWIKDICQAQGFLLFNKKDLKPFLRQIELLILSKLRLLKRRKY